MTFIETKKAEIRAKWERIDEQSWNERSQHPDPATVYDFIIAEIDTLLDEIQEAVIAEKPKFAKEMVEPGKTWWEGWLMNRAKTIEAFQHLHTGEDITS